MTAFTFMHRPGATSRPTDNRGGTGSRTQRRIATNADTAPMAMRAAPATRMLTVDGVQVACTSSGAGEPIVLLHASGSSGAQWRDVTARLSDRYTLIAPDQYGCGGTPAWTGRHAIRVADHARLVAAVIRQQGGRAHLVGHSFGGVVALRVALDTPHLLRSLTVIEPVAFQLLRGGEEGDAELYAEVRALGASVFESTLSGHGHAGMQRFVDYWNGDGSWARLAPATQDRLALQIGGIAANFSCVFADWSRLADYQRIAVPTLVLSGGRSPKPAIRVAECVAAAIPGARRMIIEGAGHMLPLTHAGTVADAVSAYVEAWAPIGAAA
jgi:pimeloyl-ACP methyl ester carboxylesterase